MILAIALDQDFLYRATQYVLIEDTWMIDVLRLIICVLSWLTGALLGKLYFDGKTGKMNRGAAFGAILTYLTVGYAQIIAIASPTSVNGITLLNVLVFIAMLLSFIGTLKVMHIGLFRKKSHDE